MTSLRPSLLLLLLTGTVSAQETAGTYWRGRSRAFADLVFARSDGPHLPLSPSLEPDAFTLPTYAGGAPKGEGVCVLGFLLSADVAADARVRPLVSSALRWTSPEGIAGNNIGRKTYESYWYELMPAVLLTQLTLRHPGSAEMDAHLRRMADRYASIIERLGGPRARFDQTGFITVGERAGPVVNGRWTEPDAAAAMAYVCYAAWSRQRAPRHLEAARHAMDALERRKPEEGSPLYEFSLYCAPALAARMNREQGTRYDVRKLLGWCLGTNGSPQSARRWWGSLPRDFGGVGTQGLCGSTRPGDAYAFAMNTFVAAAQLAPLAAEDPSFAGEIGEWLALVGRNARRFFADEVAPRSQSAPATRGTALAAIPYEGLRERKRLTATLKRTAPGAWLATLPGGDAEIRWSADFGAQAELPWRIEIKDAGGRRLHQGEVRLKAGKTTTGGGLPSAPGPLRVEFTAQGRPADPTKFRVELHYPNGPWLTGDPVFFSWGAPTDLSVYGGAHLGSFAALFIDSDTTGLHIFDLAATHHLGQGDRPTRLYLNQTEQTLKVGALEIPARSAIVR